MDEMNDQEMPAESTDPDEQPVAESSRSGRKRGGLLGGLLSGVMVGGVLALLLAPLREEERAQMEGGRLGGREGLEAEGRLRARVTVERAQAIGGSLASGVAGLWSAVRQRLRDAVEEGKEGIAEGQEEARTRYEFMTKRRRPRRS